MDLKRVESSHLKEAGYDPEERKLVVVLHSGKTYTYFSVPPEVYEAFLGAKSVGAFFNRSIRGQFHFTKE